MRLGTDDITKNISNHIQTLEKMSKKRERLLKKNNPEDNEDNLDFSQLNAEFKSLKEEIKSIKGCLKDLVSAYQHDVKKVAVGYKKHKRPRKITGFAKKKDIPEKLAKFIGVDVGTTLSGPEITSKVWRQLKDRGLTYENDRRIFRVNKEVSELFGVPPSVNVSANHRDPKGFNFYNLQSYIANAMKN